MSLISCVLVGCSKEDPIKLLKKDKNMGRYDVVFWVNEKERDTFLWHEAHHYCVEQNHTGKPNCIPIFEINWFSVDEKKSERKKGRWFGPGDFEHILD